MQKTNFTPIESPAITTTVFQILLALAEGEQHGYRIMQTILRNSQGQFRMGPGTLYGSIKRMLDDGMIEESGDRPDPALDDERRRYYRITESGRRALSAEAARLDALVSQARRLDLIPANGGDHP